MIRVISIPESQIPLHFAFKTNHFQVTGHFEAGAQNDPPSHIKCYQVKGTHLHVLLGYPSLKLQAV